MLLLVAKEGGGGTLLGRCSGGRKTEAAISSGLPILTALLSLSHFEIDICLIASGTDTIAQLLSGEASTCELLPTEVIFLRFTNEVGH